MNRILSKNSRVKIVYYSGTGGTARVAGCFEKALNEEGYVVNVQPLRADAPINREKHDLLVLLYAVHACNAPEAVYNWIENTEKVCGTPAVVISISGGGEITPNTACRLSCIKKLEKKGYKVTYEEMIVMPSNWIVQTKEPLALMLLEILPKRVKKTVGDILSGVERRTKPLFIDRLLSMAGELEKVGARFVGRCIKVSDACNCCGWCARNCPAGNITINAKKPVFGGKCHLCLGCIYGCPSKALSPGIGKFIVVKGGYSLKELERKLPCREQINVEELAKGYIWSGVRKYLLEQNKL